MNTILTILMDQLIQTFISIISDKYNISTYELKELWERNETNRTIVQEKSSKRSSNGKTEVYNIKNILKHLNNNTDIGKKTYYFFTGDYEYNF